jgi:hypothetical protein
MKIPNSTNLAAELAVGDVELTEHMARRKGHLIQIRRVPGSHDDSSILRTVLDLVDAVLQLIDPFASVIRVHIEVLE